MSAAYLTMSHRELDRSEVMHRLLERRLSHRQAAVMLGLSTRQCERLFARYKRAGPQALVSRSAAVRRTASFQRTNVPTRSSLCGGTTRTSDPRWRTRSWSSSTGSTSRSPRCVGG